MATGDRRGDVQLIMVQFIVFEGFGLQHVAWAI